MIEAFGINLLRMPGAEFTRLDQLVRAARQGHQAVGGIPSARPGDRPK